MQYLQTRHGWDEQTRATVDWQAFTQAASTHSAPTKQLLKMVHDKLPTNYYKAKRSPNISAKCHFCSENETFHHLCTTSCNPDPNNFDKMYSSRLPHTFMN